MSEHEDRMRAFAEQFPPQRFPDGPEGPMARFRGDKGDKGDKGDAGVAGGPGPGLSAAVRRAFAYLFVLTFLLIMLAYWGLYRQQQGDEQQRCAGIAETVGLPVPVPTAGNPSRAWIASQSRITRMRGKQLGCKMPPPRFAPSPSGN